MYKSFHVKLLVLGLLTVFVASLIVGCGSFNKTAGEAPAEGTAKTAESSAVNSFKEFTLTTMDHEVRYTHIPKRVVSLNLHTTENLIALDLENLIIGTAFTNAEVLPEYKEKFNKIPKLAEKYPAWEVLLNVQPDFIFGRSSAFGEKGVAEINKLLDNNIMVYVAKETYTPGSTIEATYEDFRNLGRMFGVETKAENLIAKMKDKVKTVTDKTSKVEKKLKVFVYDSGTEQAFTSGKSLQTNLIELAGGKNIFDDIDKTWGDASWEELVKRNPEVIVINDYAPTTAKEKIDFLKSKKALSEVEAIKNNRFVVLPLPSIFTGVRNADAVDYLAKGFYPELFK